MRPRKNPATRDADGRSPAVPRHGRIRAALALASVALLVLGCATTATSQAPAVADDTPVHSRNIQHVANLAKQAPFDAMFSPTTDLAFTGKHAIAGNFGGFTVYDIGDPRSPKVVSQVVCPGAQNDVSVAGDLLFLSTDDSRSDDSCQSTPKPATDKSAWEGIKIFDISDVAHPRYVTAVETPCGSHTHTLVPGKGKNRGAVYVYVSSYLPDASLPDCRPPHDKISIIKVALRDPARAAVVAEPVLFPDGGNPGGNGSTWYPTTGCHDLTAYPEKDLAAGACMGDGVLLDISAPERPYVITTQRDTANFAFWHSATFGNRGDKVVFTDELGGGFAATCNAGVGAEKGANAIYAIKGKGDRRTMELQSYYKIPRAQTATENCVAHYGALIPTWGRDVMVQAWYQGGVSVWDFTDARKPHEIAYFDRGPLSETQLLLGGAWSAYYYNGYIYVADTQKGLDVIDIRDLRTATAKFTRYDRFNPQTQVRHPR
ncbi:LVIVD repeat-containing protein [Streptosporangium sp. NPDC050855]|uniref:LVIVD repeat-containing protein n=1 Tax=Streptosporangium sp. NPDC050855 TaxID=3366194 RepID=UPI0037B17A3B